MEGILIESEDRGRSGCYGYYHEVTTWCVEINKKKYHITRDFYEVGASPSRKGVKRDEVEVKPCDGKSCKHKEKLPNTVAEKTLKILRY